MMRDSLRGIVVFFFLFFAAENSFSAPPLPKAMFVLGDSVAAGALAHTSRRVLWSPTILLKFSAMLASKVFVEGPRPFEMHGFSFAGGLSENGVRSHARILKEMNQKNSYKNFWVYNGAKSTSHSDQLFSQVNTMANTFSENELSELEYGVIFIGGNDACATRPDRKMVETSVFLQNYSRGLKALTQLLPKARVLVVSVPDFSNFISNIANARLAFTGTCRDAWRWTGFCPSLINASSSDKVLNAVKNRISDYNTSLEKLVYRHNQSVGWEQLRLAKSASTFRFGPEHVAVDCFHPNKKAHSRIAELTFAESWWAQ